jgi:glycosyltransferase involved in cell wall biosynthesis
MLRKNWMSMNIAYIITKSEIGGAQVHLLDLINALSPKLSSIYLITGGEGWLTSKLSKIIPRDRMEFNSHLSNTYSPLKILKSLFYALIYLKKIKPDLIHAHSSIAGIVARISGRLLGIPVLFTVHGTPLNPHVKRSRRLIALGAEKILNIFFPCHLIFVSNYDKEIHENLKFSYLSSNVVYNGVKIENFKIKKSSTNIKNDNNLIKIVMIARFEYPKSPMVLIRALHLLNFHQPQNQFHLSFIGDGPLLPECKKLVEDLKISSQVTFLGARDNAKELLCDFDLVALASKHEGLPLSLLEACAAGLPIISNSVGGIPEIVSDEIGYFFNPDDLYNLIKIFLVIDQDFNSDEFFKKGLKSREVFESKFTVDKMIEETFQIYQNIIKS